MVKMVTMPKPFMLTKFPPCLQQFLSDSQPTMNVQLLLLMF